MLVELLNLSHSLYFQSFVERVSSLMFLSAFCALFFILLLLLLLLLFSFEYYYIVAKHNHTHSHLHQRTKLFLYIFFFFRTNCRFFYINFPFSISFFVFCLRFESMTSLKKPCKTSLCHFATTGNAVKAHYVLFYSLSTPFFALCLNLLKGGVDTIQQPSLLHKNCTFSSYVEHFVTSQIVSSIL